MAAGRIITGYSKPYVAEYDPTNDTYSNGMQLARGVSIENNIESADDNDFRADNVVAESAKGKFGSGSGKATVDGLKRAAQCMIYGIPAPGADGILDYDDDMEVPYVGLGYIIEFQEDGVVTYVPMLLCKVMFKVAGDRAETRKKEIDWQTQELEYTIFRSDNAKHRWKREGDAETTEAAAEAKLRTMLGIAA